MEYQLVVLSGRRRGALFGITAEGVVLGRDANADIVIQDPTVSRKHCRICLREDGVLFEDLGSLNPALINGMPARDGELKLGDEIALGFVRLLLISEAPQKELGQASVGEDTWSLSHLEVTAVDADAISPSLDARPRTVQDLAFLHETTCALGDADTVAGAVAVLQERLNNRFRPTATWAARVSGQDDLVFLQPAEASPDPMVADVMLKAIQQHRGILIPGAAVRDGRKVFVTTLAVPVRLAGMTIGALVIQTEAPRGVYDEGDLRLLVLVAQVLAPYLRAMEDIERLRRDNERLRNNAGESLALVGDSKAVRQVRAAIARAAQSDLSVLITGESGTGKELAARLVHAGSSRRGGQFVVVNCAAIPRDLFESEFFGYEKGAFTGAAEAKMGLFSLAHGGTLFLDEIGNLSLDNQARILRAIELGTFRRVGAEQEVKVDVRIVAATNTAIPQAVKEGRFREDLYHRINGFEIRMPSLREHPSDIRLLASYFFQNAHSQAKSPLKGFAPETLDALSRRTWPGNVRELRNAVVRGIAMARGEWIRPKDVGPVATSGNDDSVISGQPLCLMEAEKQYVLSVLKHCDGNIPEAARILDVSRSTLYRKLAEYGVRR